MGLLCAPLHAAYDPLMIPKTMPGMQDMVVKDAKRDREIPIRVYLPASTAPAPVVLFSHGLGGSRENNPYLGNQWAARGYVVVFLQHLGSDESVWKDKPITERMAALKNAADLKNFLLRVQDVPVVIDQLTRWNQEETHPLKGRLDLKHLGMSGHSFGGSTTQAVSGQAPRIGKGFTDARIQAAVIMSPSSPASGNPKTAFGQVKMPWMILTGTKDSSPLTGVDPKDRLLDYPELPAGQKYQLILDNAEHSAFGDRALPGEREKRNPNHHRAILALTTAFWDSYLRDDAEAKKWLDSDAVRGVLEKADQWQKK